MILFGIFLLIFVVFLITCLILRYVSVWRHSDCKSNVCLIGKTALVTGGSQGIGYQIVLGLASRGCRVIIADCNVNESIKDSIKKETNNPNIILKYVNLASFKSVREFANDIRKSEDKIDILINNAGVWSGLSVLTEDGINITLQVNYYSAFLLTHLLLELLIKSESGARIIFTTSLMSYVHPLTAKGVQEGNIEKGYEYFGYPISKFCQLCASDVLAEKLEPFGITSNCFHPYLVKTNIFLESFKSITWYEYFVIFSLYLISFVAGKTATEAAQTGIYLACANEARYMTGAFMGNIEPSWRPRGSTNRELKEAIWRKSERVVKLTCEERIP